MRGSILSDIEREPKAKTGFPLVFGISSPYLRRNSSSFSLPVNQRHLIVLVLAFSGRRISQVLNMRHIDIMDDIHIWFKGHKRGQPVTIALPAFLITSLKLVNPKQHYIFNVNYKSVYSYVLKIIDNKRFQKCKKNRSVTHCFRKESFKRQLLEYGNTLDILCRYYGWEDKRSAFYYL